MNVYSKFKKEIHVGLLSLLVLGGSLFLFWKEGAVDFGEGKKEIVGNITFKYRTAQRKFSDHMIWQDVEQNFPIFNQDSVRTDELSEAVVTLRSGTKFELDPRSMIVIHLKEEEELLKLEEGSVKVQSDRPVSLISDKTTFQSTNEPSLFRITREESNGENTAESFKGNLKWFGANGAEVKIKEGEKARTGNDTLSPIREEWKLLEPNDNHRIFPETVEAKIGFRWKSDSPLLVGLLEVSLNRSFAPLVFKKEFKGESTDANFPEGIYYWRLVSADKKKISEVRKFRILPNPPVALLFPLKNTTLEGSALQSFRWKPSRLATGYILEISQSADFKTELRQLTVFKTSISIPLYGGKYHWRVKAFSNLPGALSVSEARSFQVENPEPARNVADETLSAFSETSAVDKTAKNETTPSQRQEDENVSKKDNSEKKIEKETAVVPTLLFPIQGRTVDMTGRNSIVFRWKHNVNSKAEKWSLNLYGGNGESILKRSVSGESFRLTELGVLDVGKFSWALIQEGNRSNQTKADFKIVLREDLAAPETKTTGKKGE
ncbi:hypothetical protein LEP1GSC060_0548 [Leptospira weilii serovar Ranarum str. ICFT]|uniref:Sigma factor regulatory protein, FecR/PupR family n=1 Tax=Leptospira weilii serovar Ranarum str. ICFT TaxID=1218598 RepID=N1WNI2_9LEPT|nr:hypothetical protein [Leptospira weilii]EMY78709.1 hypothetical protein LEP1GSC060_0548 [Leptospira weilii serovar Ranarum str. ICFT]